MKVVESTLDIVLKTVLVTMLVMLTFMASLCAWKEYQIIQAQRSYIQTLESSNDALNKMGLKWYKELQETRAKLIVSEARNTVLRKALERRKK